MKALILFVMFAMAVPSSLMALSRWRWCVLLAIPVGFAQEPIRKMVPGQPVLLLTMVVMVMILAFAGAMIRLGRPNLHPLTGGSIQAHHLLSGFIALIVFQSLHSLISYRTPMVPLIGMLAYLLPMPALWLAFQYVRNSTDVMRFVVTYVVVAAVMSAGVMADYYGFDSDLFKQIGDTPLVVYHPTAGIVELYCGLMRSPDIAAWHAAALGCLAVVVAVSTRNSIVRAISPAFVIYALYTVILTGRRKSLAVMVLFGIIYFLGLLFFQRRTTKTTLIITVIFVSMLASVMLYLSPDVNAPSAQLQRSATTFSDAGDRFRTLGLESVVWAYSAGGLFGLGTGAGAQGTQHFMSEEYMQGAAEGGLGRIMVELGPIGLIIAVLCAVSVARQTKKCLGQASRHNQDLLRLILGLLSFIAANVPVFIGAAQIFGDPFVLVILGLQLGFVLSVPRIIKLERARVSQAGHDIGLAAAVAASRAVR